MSNNLELDDMWDILTEEFGVTGETLQIITDMNGYTQKTFEDVLYAVSGYRSFDQVINEE